MLKIMDRNALQGFLKSDDTTAFPTPLIETAISSYNKVKTNA